MSNINDQMAAQIKVKTKLMAHEFEQVAIYGDSEKALSSTFHRLVASNMEVHMEMTAAYRRGADSGEVGRAGTRWGWQARHPADEQEHPPPPDRQPAYRSYQTERRVRSHLGMWGDDIPIIATD